MGLGKKLIDIRGLVSRQVVGNRVDFLALGLVSDEIGQKCHELGAGVASRGLAQYLARLGVEGGISAKARGSTGSLRSSGWIALFSSMQNTVACASGFRYSPMTSAALDSKSGSLEQT